MRICFAWLTLIVLLGGCLPFGNRSEPRELFPADSLSRAHASTIGVEPLEIVRRFEPEEEAFFSSIQLGPDSLVWVADLSSNQVRRFTLEGIARPSFRSVELDYPYLAGGAGDVVAIFNAGSDTLLSIENDSIVAVSALPARAGGMSLSRFVFVLDNLVFVKDTGSRTRATISVHKTGGRLSRAALPGQPWRYHGILRRWGSRVAGSSSFRPTIYLFDTEANVDSMSLLGFDSPMLARSRSFELGEVSEPPLMISAFSAIDNRLFVLNVRPGILRVDEYDETGTLRRTFQREEPEPDPFSPGDLLVIENPAGRLAIYVVSTAADYGALSLTYSSRLDILKVGVN